jgi:uncharacterized protein YbjQ (UPF0145 family)
MAKVTGLSGNEIYCLALKQYSAGELVVGNSVNSMGFLGSLGAGLTSVLGGEVPQVTQAIHEGRAAALARLTEEASRQEASGVAGVTGELRSFSGSTEFLFVGSCVHSKSPSEGLFTSAGDAQELFCHMDAGYEPVQHVFGNVAYSIGVGGGILGSLKTLARGEIREFSDVFNHTRHAALDRVVGEAQRGRANSVVGIRTTIQRWAGTHEMMAGTAAFNSALHASAIVTSDLTGEELWAMTSLGYAPIKLLMSTSIYSLGLTGGFLAALKSLTRGEISELTRLVHDARNRDRSPQERSRPTGRGGRRRRQDLHRRDRPWSGRIHGDRHRGEEDGRRRRRHAHLAGSGHSPRQGHLDRRRLRLPTGSRDLSHPARVAKLCGSLSRPRFLLVKRARRPPTDEHNQ